MAAVQAPRSVVEATIAGIEGLVVANHNAPLQSIVSGSHAGVDEAAARFAKAGIDVARLPVAAAFHSPLVQPAQRSLAALIETIDWHAADAPVYSNTTARPHAADVVQTRRQMAEHLVRPVEFAAEIEAMHADGARVFLEVGPKSVLSRLVAKILDGKPHAAIALDDGTGLPGLLNGLAQLACAGVAFDVAELFAGRSCKVGRPRPARLAEARARADQARLDAQRKRRPSRRRAGAAGRRSARRGCCAARHRCDAGHRSRRRGRRSPPRPLSPRPCRRCPRRAVERAENGSATGRNNAFTMERGTTDGHATTTTRRGRPDLGRVLRDDATVPRDPGTRHERLPGRCDAGRPPCRADCAPRHRSRSRTRATESRRRRALTRHGTKRCRTSAHRRCRPLRPPPPRRRGVEAGACRTRDERNERCQRHPRRRRAERHRRQRRNGCRQRDLRRADRERQPPDDQRKRCRRTRRQPGERDRSAAADRHAARDRRRQDRLPPGHAGPGPGPRVRPRHRFDQADRGRGRDAAGTARPLPGGAGRRTPDAQHPANAERDARAAARARPKGRRFTPF